MKPALLIDFDGTLCYDRFWRSLEPVTKEKVHNFFISNKDSVDEWMRGGYVSEEINKKIADACFCDYDMLWNTFVNDCKTMYVSNADLVQINGLRKIFITFLITDNMDCFNRFTAPSLKLDAYFDEIINSFDKHLLKTYNNGQLFQEAVVANGADISKSILIDNSEGSCIIFERLGGKAFLVTKEKPLTYWLKLLLDLNLV